MIKLNINFDLNIGMTVTDASPRITQTDMLNKDMELAFTNERVNVDVTNIGQSFDNVTNPYIISDTPGHINIQFEQQAPEHINILPSDS